MAAAPTFKRAVRAAARKHEERAVAGVAAAKRAIRGQVSPLLSVMRTEHEAVGEMALPLLAEATAKVAEIQAQVNDASARFSGVINNSWFQDFMAPSRPRWANVLLPRSVENLIDNELRPEFYRGQYLFSLLQNTGATSLGEFYSSGWGSDRPEAYTFRGEGLFSAFYGITTLLDTAYTQSGSLITTLERANEAGGRPVRKMCGVGLPQLEPSGGRYLTSERRFGERTFYEYADLGRAHTSRLLGITATSRSLVAEVDALARSSSSMNRLIREIRSVLEDYIPLVTVIISGLETVDSFIPRVSLSSAVNEMRQVRTRMALALVDIKGLQTTLRPIRSAIRRETPVINAAISDIESTIATLWSPCRLVYPATVDEAATEADRLDTSTWVPGTPRTAPRLDRDRIFLPRTGRSAGRLESESDREEEVLAFSGYGSMLADEPTRFMGLLPWQALAIAAGAWMFWPEKNK